MAESDSFGDTETSQVTDGPTDPMTCLDISRCRVIGDIGVVVSSSSQAG